MALANKLGGLLKKATGSSPSIYQAIRCMSSSKLFVGGSGLWIIYILICLSILSFSIDSIKSWYMNNIVQGFLMALMTRVSENISPTMDRLLKVSYTLHSSWVYLFPVNVLGSTFCWPNMLKSVQLGLSWTASLGDQEVLALWLTHHLRRLQLPSQPWMDRLVHTWNDYYCFSVDNLALIS